MSERLAAALEARRADGRGLAILLIDCGLISRIDAVWGYPVGDAVRASVPAGAKVKAVQVRIFDSGSAQARVTQGVTLN